MYFFLFLLVSKLSVEIDQRLFLHIFRNALSPFLTRLSKESVSLKFLRFTISRLINAARRGNSFLYNISDQSCWFISARSASCLSIVCFFA